MPCGGQRSARPPLTGQPTFTPPPPPPHVRQDWLILVDSTWSKNPKKRLNFLFPANDPSSFCSERSGRSAAAPTFSSLCPPSWRRASISCPSRRSCSLRQQAANIAASVSRRLVQAAPRLRARARKDPASPPPPPLPSLLSTPPRQKKNKNPKKPHPSAAERRRSGRRRRLTAECFIGISSRTDRLFGTDPQRGRRTEAPLHTCRPAEPSMRQGSPCVHVRVHVRGGELRGNSAVGSQLQPDVTEL